MEDAGKVRREVVCVAEECVCVCVCEALLEGCPVFASEHT